MQLLCCVNTDPDQFHRLLYFCIKSSFSSEYRAFFGGEVGSASSATLTCVFPFLLTLLLSAGGVSFCRLLRVQQVRSSSFTVQQSPVHVLPPSGSFW